MIEVRRSQDVEGIIRRCYCQDNELLEKFHVLAPTTEEKAVEHTVKVLSASHFGGFLILYELYVAKEFAGYFGVERVAGMELLAGMFVCPQFRNREFMQKYWKIIRSKFSKRIHTYLYDKNTRAIAFVKRNGFKRIGHDFEPSAKQYISILAR